MAHFDRKLFMENIKRNNCTWECRDVPTRFQKKMTRGNVRLFMEIFENRLPHSRVGLFEMVFETMDDHDRKVARGRILDLCQFFMFGNGGHLYRNNL